MRRQWMSCRWGSTSSQDSEIQAKFGAESSETDERSGQRLGRGAMSDGIPMHILGQSDRHPAGRASSASGHAITQGALRGLRADHKNPSRSRRADGFWRGGRDLNPQLLA